MIFNCKIRKKMFFTKSFSSDSKLLCFFHKLLFGKKKKSYFCSLKIKPLVLTI